MINLQVIQGDITKVEVGAIVNAANTSLLGGGGVDGAIHRAGGPKILEECREIRNRQGGCKVGNAVITTAGNLSADYVLHCVGPKWNKDDSEEKNLLRNAYLSCLNLCVEHEVESVVFPCISTGRYGFPNREAAKIAIQSIQDFDDEDTNFEVIFCCYDLKDFEIYKELLDTKNQIL